MNEQEQRIAIAEFCGWKWRWKDSQQLVRQWSSPKDNSRFFDNELPDYCHDLNAMHEAEKVLKGSINDEHSEVSGYSENLTTVIYGDGELESIWFADLIRATASQRAEAFLKTIGKWKD